MKSQTIPAHRLISLLRSLGFEEERGKDHIFFYFRCLGKIVVRTKISHGAREISQPILGLIGRQLKLGRRELDMKACSALKVFAEPLKSRAHYRHRDRKAHPRIIPDRRPKSGQDHRADKQICG